MASRRGGRNNVLAGVFVLAALALAATIVLVLSNAWERWTVPMTRYAVKFSLAQGAEGLDTGSPVKVGGVRVGQVRGWEFALEEETGRPVGVKVEMEIRSDIVLYEDATPLLVLPLLGSGSSINFPSVGTGVGVVKPQGGDARLTRGEELTGALAPPAFLTQAGYGPEQANQVQRIIRDFEDTASRLNRLTGSVEGRIEPGLEKLDSALWSVQRVAESARTNWVEWSAMVASVLEQLEGATRALGRLMGDARAGVGEARDLVASGQVVVDENAPKIGAALDSARSLAAKMDEEAYGEVVRALENAGGGIDAFVASAERISALVARRTPDLDAIIANGRIASDQMKLTMTEVRAAPWKVFSRPTGRKELETEVLYDSVRAYAAAVSDLRAAAEALESVRVAGRAGVDEATVREISERLALAFEKYQEAERAFLRRWSEAGR